METRRKVIDNNKISVSLLFEDGKFSYIEKEGKTYAEKEIFYTGSKVSWADEEKVFELLNNNKCLSSNYNFIDISVLTDKFTLVPLEYFDEDMAETFLNYNVPYSKTQGIRFNLVPQLDLALVFYYTEKFDSFFSKYSDKVRISHAGFKFLTKIKSTPNKNGFFINICFRSFELAILENEKLILYNVYPYNTIDDIIYFLNVIFKNINNQPQRTNLYYYGELRNKEEDINKLSQYFRVITPGAENEFEQINFTLLEEYDKDYSR